MRLKALATTASTLGLVLALAACAGQTSERAQTHNEKAGEKLAHILEVQRNVKGWQGPVNVRSHNDVWLGSTGIKSQNGQPLPARFQAANAFSIFSAAEIRLPEISQEVSEFTGIPVVGVSALGQSIPGAAPGGRDSDPLAITMRPNYSGPLSGFLDQITAHFGVSWEYRDGTIRLFDVETRQWTLYVAPFSSSITAEVSSANAGLNGGAGGQESTTAQGLRSEALLNHWSRIEMALKSMLPENASYSIAPDTGTITVTARGPILDRVSDFIKRENAIASRQVAVNVQVFSIDNSEIDQTGIDLDELLVNVGQTVSSVGLSTILGGAPAVVSETVLQGAFSDTGVNGEVSIGGARATYDVNGNLKRLQGGAVLAKILKADRRASLMNSVNITTMNNQPAPIQVTTQQGYLRETDVTTSGDDNIEVDLTPGTITTGFSMNVLPRVLENGQIALNYNIALSDLESLTEFESNGSTIQIPKVNNRGLIQNVIMQSGDTLILGGFEEVSASDETGQTGLFGRSADAEVKRKAIIILLTPVALDGNGRELSVAFN